jgi:hypothetical protein
LSSFSPWPSTIPSVISLAREILSSRFTTMEMVAYSDGKPPHSGPSQARAQRFGFCFGPRWGGGLLGNANKILIHPELRRELKLERLNWFMGTVVMELRRSL